MTALCKHHTYLNPASGPASQSPWKLRLLLSTQVKSQVRVSSDLPPATPLSVSTPNRTVCSPKHPRIEVVRSMETAVRTRSRGLFDARLTFGLWRLEAGGCRGIGYLLKGESWFDLARHLDSRSEGRLGGGVMPWVDGKGCWLQGHLSCAHSRWPSEIISSVSAWLPRGKWQRVLTTSAFKPMNSIWVLYF
jgi:hypothetical protein